MAIGNQFYPNGAVRVLNKLVDWDTDDIYVMFVNNTYTFNLADDQLSDIADSEKTPLGDNGKQLASISIAGGIFDAADVVFSGVTGTQIIAIVIYQKGIEIDGTDSYLLCYLDTATGLPLTPNGGDITIQWSDTFYKIFSLVPSP